MGISGTVEIITKWLQSVMMLGSARPPVCLVILWEKLKTVFKMSNENHQDASKSLVRKMIYCSIFLLKMVGLARVKWDRLHD